MPPSLPPWLADGLPSMNDLLGNPGSSGPDVGDLAEIEEMANNAAVCMANVETQAVEWLWPGYLPRGMLVLLDGDPGLGKSFLTLDLAARLSSGRPMPPDTPPSPPLPRGGTCTALPPQQVLLLNAEDDIGRTVQPRLKALGADLSRCYATWTK